MATNIIHQDNDTMVWTNTSGSDVASNDAVPVGDRVGVALEDIAQSAQGVLQMSNVVATLPKAGGVTISQGQDCYLNAGVVTNVAAGGVPVGQAWADAASGDTHVNVGLGPCSTPGA